MLHAQNAASVSPHNQALYEAGKDELIKSAAVGRDFAKSMVTVSTGAIAVYTGLIKFIMGDKFVPSGPASLAIGNLEWPMSLPMLVFLPGFVFLISSLVFAWASMPQSGRFSLNLPDEFRRHRQGVVRALSWGLRIGFLVFSLGNLLAVVVIMQLMQGQLPRLIKLF